MKKSAVDFDTKNLLCKANCGYFGNPEWNGFCSKCHKDRANSKLDSNSKSKSSFDFKRR